MTSWYLPRRTSLAARRRGATWLRRPDPCEPAAGADRQDAVDSGRAAVLADQLCTPLTAVYGAIQTLRRPDVEIGSDVHAELLEMAAEQAERLSGIVDELLRATEVR